MTVYVLGAGASKHAGYPLAREMCKPLFAWMIKQVSSPPNNYPAAARFLEETVGQCGDIESLLSRAQILIDRGEKLGEHLPKQLGPGADLRDHVAEAVQ